MWLLHLAGHVKVSVHHCNKAASIEVNAQCHTDAMVVAITTPVQLYTCVMVIPDITSKYVRIAAGNVGYVLQIVLQ